MNHIKKLFKQKPYNNKGQDQLFTKAMKENCLFHYQSSETYRRICISQNFHPDQIKTIDDLEKIPIIPTAYLKQNEMLSVDKKKLKIKVTSSGTSGKKSVVGFDLKSIFMGLRMLLRLGKYHKLFSLKPSRFIVMGYEYTKKTSIAISKSTYVYTFFSPALSKDYALKYINGEYKLDLENIKQKLIKYSKKKAPVRINGFPSYTYFLLKQMKDEGFKLKLPKGSMLSTGGGWKQFQNEQIDKNTFYDLVNDVVGIPHEKIFEFFSAVEHPVLYVDCKYHHFHVPAYARVLIRDVHDLKVIGANKIGLVNLLSPIANSIPLTSIMTDDLGILHDTPCPCGLTTPYLELISRVGVKDVVTCAQGASEYLVGGAK
ncbi:acyl-protein synthetase [Acholeplasma hippikon]|nr:acyl-protein synthetase [Acholeplasma hippikon]